MPAAKLILIVEDEQPIREMVAFGLKRAGFEVDEAPDSRTAITRIADRRPDLAIVDWMLPDMSGLELTRKLKRDAATRTLPVIMLTARAAESDKVSGLDSFRGFAGTSVLILVGVATDVSRKVKGQTAMDAYRKEGLELDKTEL